MYIICSVGKSINVTLSQKIKWISQLVRKFNNGLYETQRRRQHQYKSPNPQPKFMTNTVNYDQGLSRNLYGR